MSSCFVRPATVEDAAEAVEVLRESIIHLCVPDHRNDPSTLERWLSNKTTEHFRQWLQAPETMIVVATVGLVLSGVGAVRRSGDLDLCYVRPGSQRQGIGGAILRALEAQAMEWGATELRLISTSGARAFYERHGYLFAGTASVPGYGVLQDYHYYKRL